MDDQRFDALTRALARGTSRRTAIKGLFGGLVGGAAMATRLDRAGAQGCDPACDGCSECVQGACVATCTGQCCNGVCKAECCDVDDCNPEFYDEQCFIAFCDDGICSTVGACGGGRRCCNSGTPEHYCAVCCGDDECPGCEICNDQGICEQPECCGDSDCVGLCGECVEGTCVSTCTGDETCCAYTNACIAPGECCTDDDCACGFCSEGTCYGQCSQDQQCCLDECIALDACCESSDCLPCWDCLDGVCTAQCDEGEECCADNCVAPGTCDCVPPDVSCAFAEVECCFGWICCDDRETTFCTECCDDSDCGDCSICSNGTCVGQCSQSQECCNDECVPLDTCGHLCIPQSGTCADSELECCGELICCIAGETSFCTECCEDSDCGDCEICDSGVCAPKSDCCKSAGQTCGEVAPTADGAGQYDCCDGLVCCFGQATNICAECCSDADCDAGGSCDDWVCVYPSGCDHDKDCPWGTCCCKDGACSSKCCHHPHPHPHPKPPKPSDEVTTLPATGAGDAEHSSGLLGVALGAAAAAFLAGKTLRENPDPLEEE